MKEPRKDTILNREEISQIVDGLTLDQTFKLLIDFFDEEVLNERDGENFYRRNSVKDSIEVNGKWIVVSELFSKFDKMIFLDIDDVLLYSTATGESVNSEASNSFKKLSESGIKIFLVSLGIRVHKDLRELLALNGVNEKDGYVVLTADQWKLIVETTGDKFRDAMRSMKKSDLADLFTQAGTIPLLDDNPIVATRERGSKSKVNGIVIKAGFSGALDDYDDYEGESLTLEKGVDKAISLLEGSEA